MTADPKQKTFDWPRAAKLRQIERCATTAPVKAVLKALDGFLRDNQYTHQTLKAISVSMGCSPQTARRAIRAAQAAGLITVYGSPRDGRANDYCINWYAVFDLPDGMERNGTRPSRTDTTQRGDRSAEPTPAPEAHSPTPHPAPVVNFQTAQPLPDLTGDPYQDGRGPLPRWKGTPTRFNRGPLPDLIGAPVTDSIDKINDVIRHTAAPPPSPDDDDEKKDLNKSGAWIWRISPEDLRDPEERSRLRTAAIEAGYLTTSRRDAIHLAALLMQAHANLGYIRNLTGYLVHHIEHAKWEDIDKKHLARAEKLFPTSPTNKEPQCT